MHKRIFKCILFFAVMSMLVFSGCNENTAGSGGVETMPITDALGRAVNVPVNAEKFAAVGPGCLRLYCYVADIKKLVGVENFEVATEVNGKPYMQANPQLKEYPIIGFGGPGNTPDAESLVNSKPDVIFTMYNYEVKEVDELQEKTNIPVVALSYGETELFDPILDNSLLLIGKITGGEDRAKEMVDYFSEAKRDLDGRTADIPDDKKPTVYLGAQSMGGMYGIESTNGNYCLFNAVHAKNVVDMIGIHKYAVLDKEKILELNPDIVFIDAGGLHIVKKDYDVNSVFYEHLSAFSGNNVHLLLPYNYYYTNLEIALANAYYIGKALYPDEFADVDPAAKFDEITTKMLGAALYRETADRYGEYAAVSFR